MSNTETQTINRWLPVVGGVSMNLALGSLYAWSTFVSPLEAEFDWTRTQTSWVFSIAIVTFAVSFVLAGRIQDRLGPTIPAAIGGTLVGLGFILASFTSSLTYLYVAFGFDVGLGNGFGYATPIPVGSKWFPDKRGLVVGLMVAGYGGGSAIVIPLANALIEGVGWRMTFRILGIVLFLMCMVGTLLLKNPPDGYRPKGWTPTPAPPCRAGPRSYSAGPTRIDRPRASTDSRVGTTRVARCASGRKVRSSSFPYHVVNGSRRVSHCSRRARPVKARCACVTRSPTN